MRWIPLRIAPALAALAFSLGAFAQQLSGDLVVAGRVVNSVTGEPVSRALVTIVLFSNGLANGPTRKNMLSTPAGEFRFEHLPEGGFVCTAEKPQFNAARLDQAEFKSPAESLVLKLEPYGTVEGTVTNADGEAIEAAVVECLEVRIDDGLRRAVTSRTVRTDDLGRYRMWNFVPGKYYLRLAGRAGGVTNYLSEKLPDFGGRESFSLRYLGGADTLNAAAPLEITPGQHATADFAVPIEPAYTIRGTLKNFSPYGHLSFQLFRNGEPTSSYRIAVNEARGLFAIHDVTAGSYVVRAIEGEGDDRTVGEAPIEMKAGDVDGLTIPLAPLGVLKGTVHCEDCSTGANGPGYMLRICLAPVNMVGEKKCGNGNRSEPFELKGILPGEYEVTYLSFGSYVESSSAGQDLAQNRRLRIQPGISFPDLTISTKTDGGQLSVTAQITGAREDTMLLAVPDFVSASGPQLFPIFEGHGEKPDLMPGDYTVFAVSPSIEFRNPEVLRSLQHGVKVHIEPRGHQRITVTELAQ